MNTSLVRFRHASSSVALAVAAAVIVAVVATPAPARAATGPYLVKDINASGSSNPYELTDMNGTLYFVAKGGGKGRELWRSDGTAAGTWLVKNINPGRASSDPEGLTAIGGLLYFSANDGVHGRELWVSDGTGPGTRLVKDINAGPGDSNSWNFTAYNGAVYFADNYGYSQPAELWRTDATAAGTYRVKRLSTGLVLDDGQRFVPFAGKLFFIVVADDERTATLWKTDGTAAGTRPFKDKDGHKIIGRIPDDVGMPELPLWRLTAVGSRLYFARYSDYRWELWRSNGTAASTHKIADLWVAFITDVDGTAFISSGDTTGGQLWRSDGTAASTVLVKVVSDPEVAVPGGYLFVGIDGRLFFDAIHQDADGFNRPRLWTSDGSPDGTQPLNVSVTPTDQSAVAGSVLYFVADESIPYRCNPCGTLWRSDGTTDGTFSIGGAPATMRQLTAVGGGLYWVSNAGGYGYELWRYVP